MEARAGAGAISDIEIAAWLVAHKIKGESISELLAFANVLQRKCIPIELEPGKNIIIDTCGTGGDFSSTINISTLSGIVLGSMGYKVAKHGNRSVSSQCGSADVLESLGYKIENDIEKLKRDFLEKNFIFLFAPFFHPAMKYVANVRKTLKIKTVFNILGPLVNPASANVHLLGVSSPHYLDIMPEVLKEFPKKISMVVHSQDGLDEISPVEKTHYTIIQNKEIQRGTINPQKLPLQEVTSLSQIRIANPQEASHVSKEVLQGKHIPGIETIALNVCACIYLVERAKKKHGFRFRQFPTTKISWHKGIYLLRKSMELF